MARKVEIVIGADTKNAEKGFKSLSRSASVSVGSLAKLAVGIAGVSAAITGVNKAVRAGISEFSEQQKVAAQTSAVLASTGAAAGVTAKQIDGLAASISAYSGIDDEAIQASENLLLTFTNIRNTVGQGNDVFSQATKAVTDLSVAMGIKGTAAALQVGKALNDPLRGYARLQRIGVAFTKSQVDQIKGFSKVGETMKAQKVILAELVREFGGSAKALGDTVPGQLNKIRETFRNLAGDLVGRLAPAFLTALTAANEFVAKIAEAKGARAKFDVVVDGIEGLGRQVFEQLQEQFRRINVGELVGALQQNLVAALRQIGAFLDRVNFSEVGRAIGEGVVRGARGAAAFLQSVNWEIVGGKVVAGIRAFLEGVNWKAVAVGTVKLLVASFKANADLLKGVGAALADAARDGFVAAANAFGRAAEILITKIVLKIVKAFDFEVLGRTVIPGIGKLIDGLEAKLAGLEKTAKQTGKAVKEALTGNPGVRGTAGRAATPKKSDPGVTPKPVEVPVVPVVDTTAVETAAEKAKKAFEKVLSRLQLGVEIASQTKPLADDLAANKKIIAALRERASITKDDLDVQHQLVAALGQQRDLLEQQAALTKAATQARQFRALGLSADGGAITPGVANLRKQLASLTARLSGSAVNLSSKLKGQLAGVRKVLSGEFGKATVETRAKIQELFATIRGEFDKGAKGPLTKTSGLNTKAIIKGLGLSTVQASEIRGRLSGFNSAGLAIAGRPTASSGGGFVGGRPIVVESHTTIQVDGHTIGKTVTRSQQKAKKRNPAQRRGPNRPF